MEFGFCGYFLFVLCFLWFCVKLDERFISLECYYNEVDINNNVLVDGRVVG